MKIVIMKTGTNSAIITLIVLAKTLRKKCEPFTYIWGSSSASCYKNVRDDEGFSLFLAQKLHCAPNLIPSLHSSVLHTDFNTNDVRACCKITGGMWEGIHLHSIILPLRQQ